MFKAKHIELRHHFVRGHIQKGDITIEFARRNDQLVDIFTQPLN